jgi:nucleotide-binding universal stress UspA family protein
MKYSHILVPVDFSDESVNAVREAIALAGGPAKVKLLHVLPPLESISPGVVWGDVTDESRMTHVRDYAANFLKKHGFEGMAFDVRIGAPGHEISQAAKTMHVDLIVVPSHGYHGMKRFLLGSVAESVIRHAECPVLVLRRVDAE